jgi:hypothetical protein
MGPHGGVPAHRVAESGKKGKGNLFQISDAERMLEGESFRDDAVCANGKRNDDVTINDEENAVPVRDIKVESLVSVPEDACEFATTQRRTTPVR